MKNRILNWILGKMKLPYHEHLFWKIKLLGKLEKQDQIWLSEKNIDIYRHDKSDPEKLIKYIELYTESDKSLIFLNIEGCQSVSEGKMNDGLIGIL